MSAHVHVDRRALTYIVFVVVVDVVVVVFVVVSLLIVILFINIAYDLNSTVRYKMKLEN